MKTLLAGVLVSAATVFGFAGIATAQPAPGCGFVSKLPWSPCAERPPVVGVTPGWTPIYGVPGTLGPGGYTPIRGNY